MFLPVCPTTRGKTRTLFLLALLLAAFTVQAQDMSDLETMQTPRLQPKSHKSKSAAEPKKRDLKDTADTGADPTPEQLAQEEENLKKCPSLGLFPATLTKADRTAQADLKLCEKSNIDCCTSDQLLRIAKWWQIPNTNSSKHSRADLRKQQIDAIGFFNNHFLKKHPVLRDHSQKIQKSVKAHDICKVSAANLETLNLKEEEQMEKFENYYKKCSDFNSELISTILCDVCDSSMASVLKLDQGAIFFNEHSCKKVTENCRDMGRLNATVLRPFIKEFEILSRCSPDGELSDVEEVLSSEMEGRFTELEDFETDGKDGPLKDEICGKLVQFGGSVNPHSEGDALHLKKLYQRTKKFFEKLESGDDQKEKEGEGEQEDAAKAEPVKGEEIKEKVAKDEEKKETEPEKDEDKEEKEEKTETRNLGKKAKKEDSIKTKFENWLKDFKFGSGKPWKETKSEGEDPNASFREKFVKRVGEFDPEDFSNLKARVESSLKNGGADKKGTPQPTDKATANKLKLKMEALLKRYWDHEGEVVKMRQAVAAIDDELTRLSELKVFKGKFDPDQTWRKNFVDHIKTFQKHGAKNRETGLFMSTVKDHSFPRKEAALKSLIDDVRAVLKSHYANRILVEQLSSAGKALLVWVDELDKEMLDNDFPKDNWPTNMCDHQKSFMFDEEKIYKKFDTLCNGTFLNSKPYPSATSMLEKQIKPLLKNFVEIYFDQQTQRVSLTSQQEDLEEFFKQLTPETFKKRYGAAKKQKNWIENITNDLSEILVEGPLGNLGDFVESGLKGKDYPSTKSDVTSYKKNMHDTVKDYVNFIRFDSNFEGGESLTKLFLKNLGFDQFKKLFPKPETVGKDIGAKLANFVNKKWTTEREAIKKLAKKNISKDSYPDKVDLKSVKEKLVRKFKEFYDEIKKQKMLRFQIDVVEGWMDSLTSDDFGKLFKAREQFGADLWNEIKKVSSDEKIKALKESDVKKVAKKFELPESDKDINKFKTKFFAALKKKTGLKKEEERRSLRRLTKLHKKSHKKPKILIRRLASSDEVQKVGKKMLKKIKAFKKDKDGFYKAFDKADEFKEDLCNWILEHQKDSDFHIRDLEDCTKKIQGKIQYPESDNFAEAYPDFITAFEKILKGGKLFKKKNSAERLSELGYKEFKKEFVDEKEKSNTWSQDLTDYIKEGMSDIEEESFPEAKMNKYIKKLKTPQNESDWKSDRDTLVKHMKKKFKEEKGKDEKDKKTNDKVKKGDDEEADEKEKDETVKERRMPVHHVDHASTVGKKFNADGGDSGDSNGKLDDYLSKPMSGKKLTHYGFTEESKRTLGKNESDANEDSDDAVFNDKTDTRRDHSLGEAESQKMLESGDFKSEEEPEQDAAGAKRRQTKNWKNRRLGGIEDDDADAAAKKKLQSELVLFERELRLAHKPKNILASNKVNSAWRHMEHRVSSQGRALELARLEGVQAALDNTERKLKFLEKSYADTSPAKRTSDFRSWRNLGLAEDFEFVVGTAQKVKKDVTDVMHNGGFKDILYKAEQVGKMVGDAIYPAAEESLARVFGAGFLFVIGLAVFLN